MDIPAAKIQITEDRPQVSVRTIRELETTIADAAEHSRSINLPNIIHITAESGNVLSLVVGDPETVLAFQYAHSNPPYFVSKGGDDADKPYFTAFGSLKHHTEFRRRNVIPTRDGLSAVREFVETGNLPACTIWEEV